MQYTRKASRSVFKQRMASAISKLRKIPKIPVQKKFKKRLIQGSALPTCQYGANLIHGSRQEMQRLRTEVAKAAGGGVEQANHHACVASLAINITLIPNWTSWLINYAFCIDLQKENGSPFQNCWSLLIPLAIDPGPGKALHTALAQLGLKLKANGEIDLHNGITINVVSNNFDFITEMLEYEWTFVISRRMSQTRKNWSAIYFDPHVLRKLGSKMTEIKLQTVMTHVNGAYYTKDFMAKFLPDCDKLCPWCDQLDSIEHRGKCKHAMQSSKTFLPKHIFWPMG